VIDNNAMATGAMSSPVPGQRALSKLPTAPALSSSSPADSSKGFINESFEWFGDLGIFFWRVVRAAATPPFEFRELFRQLDEIGSKSLPLVALAGAATGVVLSLEARYSLTRFGAKSLLPAAIVFSVIHETGPIITGLVVSGRVGAGIGAELASMKVTEQIDAIEASAVNPYRLLAATRIVACILMLPLLTLAGDACGLFMGWVAQALVEPLSLHQFISTGFSGASFHDLLPPTAKTAVFGLIIGLIACFQGMRTQGGAAGVGRAATNSVVLSSLFVILADVVLVKLILILFP
jgi:phospholipid/cholesterol/gamma-HCH transport system permease protein